MSGVQIVQLTLGVVAVILFALGAAANHEKDGALHGAGLMFISAAIVIEMYLRFTQ